MSIEDRVRPRVAKSLRPGEVIQVAFPASDHAAAAGLSGGGISPLTKKARAGLRLVVVTNERILVYRRGFTIAHVKELLWELPRETVILDDQALDNWGWRRPLRQVFAGSLGEELYVQRRYNDAIVKAAADRDHPG